jgi:hypothetical protein
MAILTVDEVREFISDYTPNNYLIDGEEMTNTFIKMCIGLGVDVYNNMTPVSRLSPDNFPSKSILLWGTLWQMYEGKAALLARNTMNYSDGGLQIPIEERFELYKNLAAGYHANFDSQARALKIQTNMESGWGGLGGDAAYFPIW